MIAWVKQHPILAGLLALVTFFLFYVILKARSAGTSATAVQSGGPSEALQAADLQANTQLQLAQLSANAQTSQLSAQLNAKQIDAATQLQIAQLSAGVASGQTSAGAAVATTNIQATLAGLVNSNATALESEKVNVGGQVDLAGIQAGVLNNQINAGLLATESTNAAAIQQAAIVGKTQETISNNQAAVTINASNNSAAVQELNISKSADIAYTQLTQAGQTNRTYIQTAGTVATGQQKTEQVIAGDITSVQKQSNQLQFQLGTQAIAAIPVVQGGTRGGFQTSVIDTALGYPTAGSTAAGAAGSIGTAGAVNNPLNAFLSGVGRGLSSVGAGLLGG